MKIFVFAWARHALNIVLGTANFTQKYGVLSHQALKSADVRRILRAALEEESMFWIQPLAMVKGPRLVERFKWVIRQL